LTRESAEKPALPPISAAASSGVRAIPASDEKDRGDYLKTLVLRIA